MDVTTRTPEDWLPILTQRLDDGAERINSLRSYTNGTSPLPELNANNQPNWEKVQERARTNYGSRVVTAKTERMKVISFKIGNPADPEYDKEKVEKYMAIGRRIWRDNRFALQVDDALDAAATCGRGYMLLGQDPTSKLAVVTAEKPEFLYATSDPVETWKSRAAIKVWRDLDEGMDFAVVWAPNSRQKFARAMESDEGITFTTFSGGWAPLGPAEASTERVPVSVLENKDGKGDFEHVINLIRRIELGILHRLAIAANQAFRQRMMSGKFPKVDPETGLDIDYNTLYEAGPGTIWVQPEGTTLTETQAVDLRQLLDAVKEDIKELAAITQTPMNALIPDSANQSAEGAMEAREGVILKARESIERVSFAINVAFAEAIRLEAPEFDMTVEVTWALPQLATLSERASAASQMKASGVPFHTIQADVFGKTDEEIAEMEFWLAQEQLALAAGAASLEDTGPKVLSPEELISRANAMGVFIRAGAKPESAAEMAGLKGLEFLENVVSTSVKTVERPEAAAPALTE